MKVYHVAGTVLGTGDTVMEEMYTVPLSLQCKCKPVVAAMPWKIQALGELMVIFSQ